MAQIYRIMVMSSLIGVLVSIGQGCAINRATAQLIDNADLSGLRTFYVVKFYRDTGDLHLEKRISDQLVKMGYKATSGPEDQIPAGVDAIVTYRDKWDGWIMNELTITIRDPENNDVLAVGNSLHTAWTSKTPKQMIEEVLTNIFNQSENGS